jgi:hypothetical protein
MRRIILASLMLLICAIASAQHMKFMGIPLDGTITTFTAKLQAKGAKISPYNSKIGAGCRWFVGSFFGEDANIFVYFDTKSKVVYRAKAVIESEDFSQLKRIYNDISESIDSKYDATCTVDRHNNYESTSYSVDLKTSADFYEGIIDLYFDDNGSTYSKKYVLHIDYYDWANRRKYIRSINDDI